MSKINSSRCVPMVDLGDGFVSTVMDQTKTISLIKWNKDKDKIQHLYTGRRVWLVYADNEGYPTNKKVKGS